MAILQQRINEAKRGQKLPILMLDAMCPGQRLQFESEDSRLPVIAESGEVTVVGVWDGRPLRFGVIAELASLGDMRWELRARDHIQVVSPAEQGEDGLTTVRVERVEDEVLPVDIEAASLLPELVEEWKGLVEGTTWEKFDGQIQGILQDLGPMPSVEDAGALALWVAALVNPLPALGVAYEVRPAALSAATVCERLQTVLRGIRGSIGHLTGKRRLF